MGKNVHILEWRPIATAPADADLELSINDDGEYHALVFPCRRDGLGCRDVSRPVGGRGNTNRECAAANLLTKDEAWRMAANFVNCGDAAAGRL
jgi:hypothetical protein